MNHRALTMSPMLYVSRLSLSRKICLTCAIVLFIYLTTRSAFDSLDLFGKRRESVMMETYDFSPTPDEESCYVGNALGTSNENAAVSSRAPMPNVVHFIFGLKDADIDFQLYLAIRAAQRSLKPEKIKLHYQVLNAHNKWLSKLRNEIELVHHDIEQEFQHQVKAGWDTAHVADWLRLRILQEEGGIYLDSDVIALRPFDNLRSSTRDVVLGHEGGSRWGLCNAIIIARNRAQFLERWIASYSTFDDSRWNYHSVLLPKIMADENPDEVCALAPSVLFWPTWTPKHVEYMHETLTLKEAEEVKELLRIHGGSLYPDQLAYHSWSQMSKKYFADLSPERIRRHDTRFNLMTRRFLNADD